MIKKICDRCGKELDGKPWFDIDAQCFGKFGQYAKSYYHYDLCEDCMIAVNNYIKGLNKERDCVAIGDEVPKATKIFYSDGHTNENLDR